MVAKFEEHRTRYKDHLSAAKAGDNPGRFEARYDFRYITFFRHEAEELRYLLVNEISGDAKITVAGIQLWQSLHSLEQSIRQRREEIHRLIELRGKISDENHARMYFGIETERGEIDHRYSDTIFAIRDLLDSAIFFSTYIVERLATRGQKMAAGLGKKDEKAVTWEFHGPEYRDLMPDKADFPDWE